jgi:kynurenine 3-monooxygenase
VVIVLGAGLVGSVCACLLARERDVSVYESRPDPARVSSPPGRSVHLVISARGWQAFEAIGVREAVEAISVPLIGRGVHAEGGGRAFIPYGPNNQTIYAVNRAKLNELLVAHAAKQPRVRIHFNRHCEAVDLDTGKLHFRCRDTGDAMTIDADRVVAADGAFSKVRSAMLRLDRFDYSQTYLVYGHKELTIETERARALEHDRMHVWPRRSVMLTAFPNVDGSFGATLLMPFEGAASFAAVEAPEALVSYFARTFPDAATLVPNLVDQFYSRPTTSIVTTQCSPWTYRGRFALIGDAAHTVVPFLGQGMNAGLEDCMVLLEAISQHGEDWSSAFSEYERRRKPQCDAMTELARQHFYELAERVADPEHRLRREIEMRISKMFPDRFTPLYAMIAFTHTPYAEAKTIAERQDAVVSKVMALPAVEERWADPEVAAQVAQLVSTLPLRGGV